MSSHSGARESAASAAAGAAAPRCATLQSALKMLQALTVPEAEESEVAALVCHVALLYRSAIFAPLAAAIAALPSAASSASSAVAGASVGLSLSAFTTLWDAKIERKIVTALGSHVCAEGSSKKGGCGPFFGPLMQDLKSRCGASSSASSATGGVTVSAVFDALGSQPMLEFHTRYFEGFIPNAIASSSSSLKFGKMSELLAAVVQVFLQDWSVMLSSRPASSTTFSSSPASLIADVVAMLRPLNSRLFLTMDAKINPLPKGASLKLSERMARELEVATRHKNMMHRFEAWAAATFGKSGGAGSSGAESAGAAGERTCKYSSCFDHEGPVIHSASPTIKWVFVRCNEGCASSFHQQCWHVVEADIEPDDETTTPEEAAVGPRCVHSRERKCKGRIVRVDLKQNGKVLSHLQELSAEEASAADADDDEDFDPTAEDAAGGVGSSNSGGLDVVGKRWRGQCKPSWYKATASSALKRIHTMEDGTTVFTDELERIEDAARKLEKRRLADEAKKKKEEEAKRKAEEEAAAAAAAPAAASSTDPSPSSAKSKTAASAPTPAAKPFVFEVVIPFAAKPAAAPKAAAPAASAIAASPGLKAASTSPVALKSASSSAASASPASAKFSSGTASPAVSAAGSFKNSNSYSALTLDDFVSPAPPVLNAWGTGLLPAAAPAKRSTIPVVVKPAKSKPAAAAAAQEEVWEVWEPEPAAARSKEEIEAGRAAKAALKQARREAREKAAAEAAEAEANVQADLEARAMAELEAEEAAAEATRAVEVATAQPSRRKRNDRKESVVEPSHSPEPAAAEAEAEAEPEPEPEAEAEPDAEPEAEPEQEPEPSALAAAAESDAELEALNEPGAAAPESSSVSPAVSSTPATSSHASPSMAPLAASAAAIEYKSLLQSHPSSAPLSAANSPEKFSAALAALGSPLRQSVAPRTPVTASPMKVSTSPVQRQALAAIASAPKGSASSSSASSSSAARIPSSMQQPTAAALAAAQLAWQRQQLELTALRMVPFAQLRAAAAATRTAAVSKAPVPVPAPLASPAVVARPAAIAMVDSIVSSYGGEPTPILLVHHLPASVSCEMLGSLFCCFGRLRVQQLYTLSSGSAGGAAGLTGVLHFHSAESAQKARSSMSGRVYDLTANRENTPHQLAQSAPHRWTLHAEDLAFAHSPLTTRQAPATVVKLVGYSRGSADACATDFNRHNAAAGYGANNGHAHSMFMFA